MLRTAGFKVVTDIPSNRENMYPGVMGTKLA